MFCCISKVSFRFISCEPSITGNRFYNLDVAAANFIAFTDSILICGRLRQIKKIMAYRREWLFEYFTQPMEVSSKLVVKMRDMFLCCLRDAKMYSTRNSCFYIFVSPFSRYRFTWWLQGLVTMNDEAICNIRLLAVRTTRSAKKNSICSILFGIRVERNQYGSEVLFTFPILNWVKLQSWDSWIFL